MNAAAAVCLLPHPCNAPEISATVDTQTLESRYNRKSISVHSPQVLLDICSQLQKKRSSVSYPTARFNASLAN
jgi:hypothetical protein